MSRPRGRPGPGANRLLATLPADSRVRILDAAELVKLPAHATLRYTGDAIDYVYFVDSGVLSLVTMMEDGRGVESVVSGFEGADGLSAILGEPNSPYDVTVQVPDDARRVSVAHMRQMVEEDPAIRNMVLRYAQVQLTQATRGAACNQLHDINERLARWLLHVHDWVTDDCLPLTQEFLGQMLGVRRASVTVAAGTLQSAGLISYQRGEILILDRLGLEEVACEDYIVIRDSIERMLPWPDSSGTSD
jgi:CRP-like cAMP-binding protein